MRTLCLEVKRISSDYTELKMYSFSIYPKQFTITMEQHFNQLRIKTPALGHNSGNLAVVGLEPVTFWAVAPYLNH